LRGCTSLDEQRRPTTLGVRREGSGPRWMSSASKFPPGVSPTPGHASANSFRRQPPPPSKKSSATPPKSTPSPSHPHHRPPRSWDLPNGHADIPTIQSLEQKYKIKAGSINPNLFQDQQYKHGSIANPRAEIRRHAVDHLLNSVAIARALNSRDISLWVSDGSNYPARKASASASPGSRKLSRPPTPRSATISASSSNTSHSSTTPI